MSEDTAEPTLAYWEWSVPLGTDLDDPDALWNANPAHGIRINATFAKIERAALTDDEYGRERLGMFADDDGAPTWEVVTEEAWLACSTNEGDDAPAGWLDGPVTLAIEMPPDRSRTSIEVAGSCREGGVGVDVVALGSGSAWVVEEVLARLADPGRPIKWVVIDPRSPAGSLIAELTEAGVVVTECSTADLMRGTGAMLDAINEGGEVRHRDSPELTAAVASARLRKAGESVLIDRWAEQDASPFIGVALAYWGHMQRPPSPAIPDFLII